MTTDDYDRIIEMGWPAFQAQFLNERIRPGLLEEFIGFLQKGPSVIEQVTAADMPYLSMAIIIQPFESLCGGRTFTQFILDLYRMPDKVEEVMQSMFQGLNDAAIAGCAALGAPGVWVGGWRSASKMLAQPLWDRFVWPYVSELRHAGRRGRASSPSCTSTPTGRATCRGCSSCRRRSASSRWTA